MNRHFRFVAPIVMMASVAAFADSAQEKYDAAKTAYANRADLGEARRAVDLLNQALPEAQDDELKYDILVLSSRSLYWLGVNAADKKEKIRLHLAGVEKGRDATKLIDDFAEGYYLAGINLGRWAEANGILESLGRKGELIDLMGNAKKRITREGAPGESVDGFGPSRTLGRMLKKLPGIFGGSRDKSLRELEQAYNRAPTLVLNGVFLADTLMDGGSSADKARAAQILNSLLEHEADPASLDPARVPEARMEMVWARDLLNGKAIP